VWILTERSAITFSQDISMYGFSKGVYVITSSGTNVPNTDGFYGSEQEIVDRIGLLDEGVYDVFGDIVRDSRGTEDSALWRSFRKHRDGRVTPEPSQPED
jgi:hypothetical protein